MNIRRRLVRHGGNTDPYDIGTLEKYGKLAREEALLVGSCFWILLFGMEGLDGR